MRRRVGQHCYHRQTSNRVALLADPMQNVGATFHSVPLLSTFYLARQVETRRSAYGFGTTGSLVASCFSAGSSLAKVMPPS